MKRVQILLIASIFLSAACKLSPSDSDPATPPSDESAAERSDMNSSRAALDWAGQYRGITPCADCAGIEIEINLMDNLTYAKHSTYKGKRMEPTMDQGSFKWNEAGSIISLMVEGEVSSRYLIGENKLIQLDKEGQRITGDLADTYILQKRTKALEIEGPTWVLSELLGTAYTEDGMTQQPFVVFNSDENRVDGNSGCNTFFGGYVLLEAGGLKIGRLGHTTVACLDMSVEQKFIEALRMADHYTINDGTLELFKKQDNLLAKFEQR